MPPAHFRSRRTSYNDCVPRALGRLATATTTPAPKRQYPGRRPGQRPAPGAPPPRRPGLRAN
eukprot:12087396-Alexandrium_andersonii.AAC.1